MPVARAVVCVDVVTVPSAVPGAPCGDGQGLATVTVQLPDEGQVVDPAQAGQFFFFGFGVIVFSYLLAFAVAQVRRAVPRR